MTKPAIDITASLASAVKSATATCENLQAALSPASAVEGLVLLALLQRARELERDVQQFQQSRDADSETKSASLS
jgi:hypothetical protein